MTKLSRRKLVTRTLELTTTLNLLGLSPKWLFANPQAAQRRLIIIHSPDGMSLNYWPTSPSGSNITLSPVLSPFGGLEAKMSLVRGFKAQSNPGSDGNHEHIRRIYTGQESAGPSIDSVLAPTLQGNCPFPIVNFAMNKGYPSDNTKEVYAFFDASGNQTLGKSTPKQAMQVFFPEVLSGVAQALTLNTNSLNAADLENAMQIIHEQTLALGKHAKLGEYEQRKLGLHAQNLQNILSRLSKEGSPIAQTAQNLGCVPINTKYIRDYDHHGNSDYAVMVEGFLDMMVAGITCSKANIFTLQLGKSAESWKHPGIGQEFAKVKDYTSHELTHNERYYNNGVTNQELYDLTRQRGQALCTWYASQVASLAKRLDQIPEGDGTVLDHTLIVWASEFGEDAAKHHNSGDLCYALVGGAKMGFGSGKYFDLRANTRYNSALLSTLAKGFGLDKQIGKEPGFVPEIFR